MSEAQLPGAPPLPSAVAGFWGWWRGVGVAHHASLNLGLDPCFSGRRAAPGGDHVAPGRSRCVRQGRRRNPF